MNDELVLNNLNLIYYVMHKNGFGHKLEEYYDVGLIGLVKAARDYDPSKRCSF